MNVQHANQQNSCSRDANANERNDERIAEQVRRNRRDADFGVGYAASSYSSDSYLGARSYVENASPRLFRFG